MKFLFILSMMFCAAHGFRFKDILSDHRDISPHNVCAGQPNGVRLPVPNDCGRFVLCDAQVGLTLSCRSAEPHFDRCSQRCVNDPSVCTITDCNGGGEQPTTPTTTPVAQDTTPTTTTVAGDTTTRFNPPTVPPICPTPCEESFNPDTCQCLARWVCVGVTCQCNVNIPCPLTNAECMAISECGGDNGCDARCICDPPDTCFCDREIECPFERAQCVARCGCAGNCNCSAGESMCVCNERCTCPQPPPVCPFAPSDCVSRCGCEERCLCNGNVCVCDLETHCPQVRNIFMMKF